MKLKLFSLTRMLGCLLLMTVCFYPCPSLKAGEVASGSVAEESWEDWARPMLVAMTSTEPAQDPSVGLDQDLKDGISSYQAGLLEQAQGNFEKYIKAKPGPGAQAGLAHHYLGLIHQKHTQYPKAIWEWKQALQKDPTLSASCFNIGLAYGTLKKVDEEIKWYRKSVTIDPRYAKAWNNLGSAWMKKRRSKEAIAAFKKALQLNPRYAVAAENLALVYEKLGKRAESKKYWKLAAQLETRPDWKKVLEAKGK